MIRAIATYFQPDIGDILIVPTTSTNRRSSSWRVMPSAARVKPYRDDAALFSPLPDRAQIEIGLCPYCETALGQRHRDRPTGRWVMSA